VHLYLLSGGAAKGLVTALQPAFTAQTGCELRATFSAVGAMKEKLLAGEPCDVTILTAAVIDELERRGCVVAETAAPLGRVRTGIAVRASEPMPAISDRETLRQSLLASTGIYLPDIERATAGLHFVKVLKSLGIESEVAARLRCYPNGATALAELARSRESGLIGCTQISEILDTPGVALVGPLPAEFELVTVYSVAVCTSAREPALARRLARLLAGPEARDQRERAGFEA
jgi:molybdate transport system substrate-binding protein